MLLLGGGLYQQQCWVPRPRSIPTYSDYLTRQPPQNQSANPEFKIFPGGLK